MSSQMEREEESLEQAYANVFGASRCSFWAFFGVLVDKSSASSHNPIHPSLLCWGRIKRCGPIGCRIVSG